jgi:hypothetical protein
MTPDRSLHAAMLQTLDVAEYAAVKRAIREAYEREVPRPDALGRAHQKMFGRPVDLDRATGEGRR